MTNSLVDTTRRMITPAIVSQLSGAHGEAAAAVEKGVAGAAIALLGVIAARVDDHGFINRMIALVREPGTWAVLDSPEKLVEQGRRAWSEPNGTIGRFQSLALGNKGALVDALARYAGVSKATATSLLAVAGAFVLGQVARLVRRDQLDGAGLARRLARERSAITAALPAGLAPLSAPRVAQIGRAERVDRPVVVSTPMPRTWSPLAWVAATLLAAIALAALLGVFRGTRPTQVSSIGAPAGSVGTSGYITRTLPGRMELHLPPSSMEGRLLTYIQTAPPFDRERWFDFDRVTFEPDSAVLRPESREQLTNIATILKAYPTVRVKIGGYTDNAGEPVANLRLSHARADAVAAQLRQLDIASSRIAMEGYGDQHPIADNSTAEGRARNRRVAIRVISK